MPRGPGGIENPGDGTHRPREIPGEGRPEIARHLRGDNHGNQEAGARPGGHPIEGQEQPTTGDVRGHAEREWRLRPVTHADLLAWQEPGRSEGPATTGSGEGLSRFREVTPQDLLAWQSPGRYGNQGPEAEGSGVRVIHNVDDYRSSPSVQDVQDTARSNWEHQFNSIREPGDRTEPQAEDKPGTEDTPGFLRRFTSEWLRRLPDDISNAGGQLTQLQSGGADVT
jgi:hypothetical protein